MMASFQAGPGLTGCANLRRILAGHAERPPSHRPAAFTLTEILVAMAVFALAVAGMVAGHLYGLRIYEASKAKLAAADNARTSLAQFLSDLRTARILRLGQGDLQSFTQLADGIPQAGNSLQVYPTTNLSNYVRYFWDPADRNLKRATNGATVARVVAYAVRPSPIFSAEDYAGHAVTNAWQNQVINLRLDFLELQYPQVSIGTNGPFSAYQLQTRITRRTLE